MILIKENITPLHDYDTVMNQIQINRKKNVTKALAASKKLLSMAKKDDDKYHLALAYYYLSESYFTYGNYFETTKYGLRGLHMQEITESWEVMMKQYNIIGIAFINQNQVQYATDYFLKCLSMAQKLGNYKIQAFITNNIGTIHMNLKDYKTAVSYFLKGLTLSNQAKKANQEYVEDTIWYINLALTYAEQRNDKLCEKYLDLTIESLSEENREEYDSMIQLIHAKLCFLKGEFETAYEFCMKTEELITNNQYQNEVFEMMLDLLAMYIKMDRPEAAKSMFEHAYYTAMKINLPNKYVSYYHLLILFYQRNHESVRMQEALVKYWEWSQKDMESSNQMHLKSIANSMAYAKIQEENTEVTKKNEQLKQQMQSDSLTKTANRVGLDHYLQTIFPKMKKEHKCFGLIIIDIDFFKEFNDTYGHLEGDRCILNIAQSIRMAVGEDGFVVRYGGDEFVVLFENKTDEQIKSYAKGIQDFVEAQKIPHRFSPVSDHVTVTQGAVNAIPVKESSFLDFVYSADMQLYQIKKSTKNGFWFSNDITYVPGKN